MVETSQQPGPQTWSEELLSNPHAVADKRRRVREMFAAIAPSYDLNNRLHSLWQDQRWRRKAVKLAGVTGDDVVIDVACGTGDLTYAFVQAIEQQRYTQKDIRPDIAQVLGIDFTFEMLPLARQKRSIPSMRTRAGGLQSGRNGEVTQFINGDAQSLPLPDQCADVVAIAFGIRNVQDPAKALQEFRRILRPGGRVIVLEFSLPTNPVLRGMYNFYFRQVLPRTATWISGDKTGAYKYLPQSVNTFIGRSAMMSMMRDAGFVEVEQHPMTFGVCICYRGRVA